MHCLSIVRKRFAAQAARVPRLRWLLGVRRKAAHRVVAAGVNPAMLHGTATLGLNDTELRRAVVVANAGVSRPSTTRSSTVALMLADSPKTHPAFEAHRPIKAWARTCLCLTRSCTYRLENLTNYTMN